MARVASVRLTKQPKIELDDTIIPKGGRKAEQPDPAMYGIYSQQYAANLNQPTNSETQRIADRIELRNRSDREAQQYRDAIDRANAAQIKLANTEGYYGVLEDQQKYLDPDVEHGMGGARGAPVWDEQYGVWRAPIDQTRVDIANANVLNSDQADRFKNYSGAIKDLRDSGVAIPDGYLGQLLTPPTQKTPVPIESGTAPLTPSQETTRYGTDQGLTAEQQIEKARIDAESRGDKPGIVTMSYSASGVPLGPQYKGTPEQIAEQRQAMIRNGIDPDTGRSLRPKAGTQGGDVPANQAAPTTVVAPKPVKDAKSIMMQLHGIAPSDWKRDPKSKLGMANPDSWHNRSGAAIDARPRELRAKYGKDYTFDDYVNSYKQRGYAIIEANDEEKHPLAHTTGPNWHVVLGEPRDATEVYASRFRASPSVADVKKIGDGTMLVTLKNGEKRVYKNGQRIG